LDFDILYYCIFLFNKEFLASRAYCTLSAWPTSD